MGLGHSFFAERMVGVAGVLRACTMQKRVMPIAGPHTQTVSCSQSIPT